MQFKQLLLLSCLCITLSCNDDLNLDCMEEGCAYINPIYFTVQALPESVVLYFGSSGHIDGPGKSCAPDAFDLYMAEDDQLFDRIKRVNSDEGSFLVSQLLNGKEYSFKVVALHCELDSVVSSTRIAIPGSIRPPEFKESSLTALPGFEDLRMSPDGDRFIYRNTSDDWYLSSISNPVKGKKVLENCSDASWNPLTDKHISGVTQTLVEIRPNLNGVTSKSLISIDIDNNNEEVLHEIQTLWNFDTGIHEPERYWLRNPQYATDAMHLYFVSNKDNGSSNVVEKQVYNNIWKLDLATKDIIPVTNFLPEGFEMSDYVEDPREPGNFYLTGGFYGDKVEVESAFINEDRVDIFYYNAMSQSLTEILRTDEKENYIYINPTGELLVFNSDRTGTSELWSYHLNNRKFNQLSNSSDYKPTKRWQHINWISDSEFICGLNQDNEARLAVFQVNI